MARQANRLTLLPVWAGMAMAQVAAPQLTPLQIGSTTANPATLQWNDSSLIGGGLSSGDQTAVSGSAPDPANEGDFKANFVQGRIVYDFFSIGAETASIEIDLGDSAVGVTNEELIVTQYALAFRIGDALALGVGQEKLEFEQSQPPTPTTTFELSLPIAGVSLRLADIYYLGLAAGTENLKANFLVGEFDRKVTRYGAGLRTERNNFQFHVEVARENREPFKVTAFGQTFDALEQTASTAVAEAIWGNILVGGLVATRTQRSEDPAGAPTEDEEISERTIAVGWVPKIGMSLVVTINTQETEDKVNPGDRVEQETVAVALGYLF